MEQITFESLPKAVTDLIIEVRELKQIFLEKANQKQSHSDRWFNLIELCEYIPDKPTKATVYSWVSSGIVPVHKSGKRLRFLKSEIDSWLQQGRKKTQSELQAEAGAYVNLKTGGGKL